MAVDTLFNDVRLLLQSGSLTNAATSSPASVGSSGVTGGATLTFASDGIITASSVSLASPAALATLELVVTPTWDEYSQIASMLGLSLNAVSPGVIGIYSFSTVTPTIVGSLNTVQSGEITLIAEYMVSGASTEIKLTAIPLTGSTTTTTVSAASAVGILPATLVLGGPPAIPVPVPGGSATVARIQAPRAQYSQQQIASLRNTNPSNSIIYSATPVSVTAEATGASYTYTITNPAGRTVDDVLSELALGISQINGAVLMAETGYYTGFEVRASLRLTFTPISSDVDNWAYSFVGMPYATAIYFLEGVYGANPPLSQISTATYTFTPGSPCRVSLTAYGITTTGLTTDMPAFVAAVSSALSSLATVSGIYPFAGQCIIYVTGAIGVEFVMSSALVADVAVPSGIATLRAARVTARRRYIDLGAAVEYPALPWPTTSIPGGEVADANTMLLMHLNESSGTELADVTGRTFTASADLASHTTASGKFSGALAPTSLGFKAVGSSSVPFPFATKELTIEFFLTRLSAGGNQFEMVFAQTDNPSSWDNGLVVTINNGTYPRLWMNGYSDDAFPSLNLSVGQWKHLAFVRTANSNTKWYVDGVGTSGYNMPFDIVGGMLPYIGNTSSGAYGLQHFGIDELRISNTARYTANFTPPTAPFGGDNGGVDVSLAGYNDLDTITGSGTFNTQLTAPDAYFFSQVTLDDAVSTGDAYTLDGNSINFTGSRTLGATTCTGTFVSGTPQNFDSDVTLDDNTAVSTFYADTPKEWTGESTLDNVTSFGLMMFLAPAMFSGESVADEVTASGSFSMIDPVVWRVNATVPAATLAARINQFFVNATVPPAELVASISAYEGFRLDATVPSATVSAWTGISLNAEVPRVTLSASATVPNTLRLDSQLPRVVSQANLLTGRSLAVNATLPAATLSAWTGLQLAASVPIASSAGNVVVGGAFSVSPGLVPMATLAAGASSMNVLRLNGAVPAASRAGWVAVNRNVPSARMLGSITPVVAVTRVAYSFTLANSAMTRYPAYPFIQVFRMGNAYYGVAEDGLYELGGTTDNGVSIPWSWETCMADFGQAEKKTVVSAYLGGYVPQNMTYTIKAGDVPTGTNAHTTTATAVLRNHRQKFGIGRKSRFFAFGLSATQGRVAIESIEFEMATMSRRV